MIDLINVDNFDDFNRNHEYLVSQGYHWAGCCEDDESEVSEWIKENCPDYVVLEHSYMDPFLTKSWIVERLIYLNKKDYMFLKLTLL